MTRSLIACALIGAGALTGCAAVTQPTQLPVTTAETTCASLAAAISALSIPAVTAKLSDAQRAAITASANAAAPYCAGSTPPTTAPPALLLALQTVEGYAAAYAPTPTPASTAHRPTP